MILLVLISLAVQCSESAQDLNTHIFGDGEAHSVVGRKRRDLMKAMFQVQVDPVIRSDQGPVNVNDEIAQ